MPTMNLTDRGVKALPAPSKRKDYRDDVVPGLVLRVTPNGVKTFSVWFRVGAKARRFTIGQLGAPWKRTPESDAVPLGLADARQRAREILADAGRGVDAVADRKAQRADAQKRDLLGESFEKLGRRFLEDVAPGLRPRSLEEYTRALEKDAFPVLGKIPPEEVTKGHVRGLVAEIAKRAPVQGNRTFATIRRVFGWAVERDMLASSPCAGLKAPTAELVRERVYSNDEIRGVVGAVPGTELKDLIPLLFHTATRSEETRAARWDDIDLEERLWLIPGDATKNRESHPVPLSTNAVAIFKERREAVPADCPWVFPAVKSEQGFMPNPGWATVTAFREKSGVPDFRLHDVRRTVATRLAEAGTPVYVIEAVLGHRPPRLVRTYQKHGYVPEARAALETWGARLARVLAGKEAAGADVVAISARAR